MKTKRFLALTAFLALLSMGAFAAQTGLWQFNGDLTAQVGTNLTIKGGAPVQFGVCSDFGVPLIGGNDAQIMKYDKFTADTEGIEVWGNLPANGGGSYANQYTFVMDYCTTSVISEGFTADYSTVFDTDPALGDDQGEMYFHYNGGNMRIGAGGRLGGYYNIPTTVATWRRIAIVVDSNLGYVKVYVDGTYIGAFARGTLISTLPDGKFSLYTGNVVSLILGGSASSDLGAGYMNSLAVYDYPLSAAQIEELGVATEAGIPAGDPVGVPELKRHSQFIGYAHGDNRPSNTGDATGNSAIDNTWDGGINGHYKFLSDGTLRLRHQKNWDGDDTVIWTNLTTNTSDMYYNIPLTSPLEIQVEWYPIIGSGRLEYFDLDISDVTGRNGSQAVGDIQTRLYNLAYGSLGIECNDAAVNGTFRVLGQQTDTITNVLTTITYDPGTTQFRVFYEFNDSGYVIEAPGSPKTKVRTQSGFRIESEQEWRGEIPGGAGAYSGHDIIVKDVKVYDSIQTTAPTSCVSGFVLRRSSFSSPAGSCASDGFWPINKPRELSSMSMPVTDEYNGTGQYVVTHSGSNATFPNATIGFNSAVSDSNEWRLQIDCDFTTSGVGQAFAMKVDGNPASFFLVNVSNTANLMFGESNPFAPNPANVVALPVAADQINEMELIIAYDGVTQTYHAYYSINGGSLTWHPSTNLAQVRASSSVEFQWQVWNGAPTDPFTVALDDYQEICGVQTVLGPPLTVPDFMLHE